MKYQIATIEVQISNTNPVELTEKIALLLVYSKEWLVEFATYKNEGRDLENSLPDWRDALLKDQRNSISIRQADSSEEINIAIPIFDEHNASINIEIKSENAKPDKFNYAVNTVKGCIAFLSDIKNEESISRIIEEARIEYWRSIDDSMFLAMMETDGLEIKRSNKESYQHLWFALTSISEIAPDIEALASGYWEEIRHFTECVIDLDDTAENLNLGLKLGLEPLDAARAYFMLMSIWLTKEIDAFADEGEEDDNNSDIPDLMLFAHNIITLTKKHLSYDYQSINALFALRLQKAAILFLNKQENISEIEQSLERLKKLHKDRFLESKKIDMDTGFKILKRNDGKDLEEQVKDLLLAMGLTASITKTTGDGGIDIIAYSNSPIFSGKYVVQCKDRSGSVGESVVRDLYGVMTAEAANKGILVTTGAITKAAQKFAEGKPLELIGGQQLNKLLHKHKSK
ncbi:MAG TPA: restriction endonuclease [Anaerolineales bacterium]|nr:restriction endonuclease [Anaerolineales bacterium]